MTYYEWVEYFNMLETAPMDEKLLDSLTNKKLYGNDYVIQCITAHVINTVKARLNNSYYTCLDNIYINRNDITALEIDLINFKKEKAFSKKIVNLSMFVPELKDEFINSINDIYNDMCNILRNNIEYIDPNGEFTSVFDKTISRNMEE